MRRFTLSLAAAFLAYTASAIGQPQVTHKLTLDTTVKKSMSHNLKTSDDAIKAKFDALKSAKEAATTVKKARKASAWSNTELVEAPAGLETEEYFITAMSFAAYSQVKYSAQVGIDGNDMYIQGLFEQTPNAWVKGTIDGDKVVFPVGQYMGNVHVDDYYTGESVGDFDTWLAYTADFQSYTDLTLSYNAQTGTLEDTAEGMIFLAQSQEVGEGLDALGYFSMTKASAFDDISMELITPPADADMTGVEISSYSFTLEKQNTMSGWLAISGDDFYVMGLCPDLPSAWVKGTKDAQNVVTFAKNQYIGNMFDMYDIFFTGTDPITTELIDVKAKWDAEEQSLDFGDALIVENANPTKLYYLDYFSKVTIYPLPEDKQPILPPAGMETTTYQTKVVSMAPQYDYWYEPYESKIGFVGDDAYIQGLFYYMPTAWVKGTRNFDGSITVQKNQYMGVIQGYDVYLVPCDDEENVYDSFVLEYNAATRTYSYAGKDKNLSFSVEPDCADAVDIIYNVTLTQKATSDDYQVVVDQPEGKLVTYMRNGESAISYFGFFFNESQNGMAMEIVYDEDGQTVWMHNPIAFGQTEEGAWVKGTIEGNKIRVPLGQCTFFSNEEGYGVETAVLKLIEEVDGGEIYYDYVQDTDYNEVTFTVGEDGTITFDLTATVNEEGFPNQFYGMVYTDSKSWANVGDYNMSYTVFDQEITTMPEGLTTESWAMMYDDDNLNVEVKMIDVAIDGNKLYIAGIAENEQAVLVGDINGNKVSFANDQYLGCEYGYHTFSAMGSYRLDQEYDDVWDEYYEVINYSPLASYAFTYDAKKKTIRGADNILLAKNCGPTDNGISPYEAYHSVKFSVVEDKAATPANPEFSSFGEYFEDYGYDAITCKIKLEDVDGRYIAKENVYYILWVNIDGEKQPFTFYADEYYGFAELGITELTEVPYDFVSYDEASWEDIDEGASYITMYETGFDDYGIQTIYYGGGERRESSIVWYKEGPEDSDVAIKSLNNDQKVKVYDLMGRMHKDAKIGLNLIVKDGKTVKAMNK